MKKIFLLVTFSLVLISHSVFASECEATRFPYSLQQSNQEFRALFDQTSRAQLESYYFYEVSEAKPEDHALGVKLADYLVNTEQNQLMLGFYALLQEAAGLQTPSDKGHAVSMKTVCKMKDAMRAAIKSGTADK